ncbi:MAG: hypothetical protein WCO66_03780 [Candidatus Absconditabacteria bacterium]
MTNSEDKSNPGGSSSASVGGGTPPKKKRSVFGAVLDFIAPEVPIDNSATPVVEESAAAPTVATNQSIISPEHVPSGPDAIASPQAVTCDPKDVEKLYVSCVSSDSDLAKFLESFESLEKYIPDQVNRVHAVLDANKGIVAQNLVSQIDTIHLAGLEQQKTLFASDVSTMLQTQSKEGNQKLKTLDSDTKAADAQIVLKLKEIEVLKKANEDRKTEKETVEAELKQKQSKVETRSAQFNLAYAAVKEKINNIKTLLTNGVYGKQRFYELPKFGCFTRQDQIILVPQRRNVGTWLSCYTNRSYYFECQQDFGLVNCTLGKHYYWFFIGYCCRCNSCYYFGLYLCSWSEKCYYYVF